MGCHLLDLFFRRKVHIHQFGVKNNHLKQNDTNHHTPNEVMQYRLAADGAYLIYHIVQQIEF